MKKIMLLFIITMMLGRNFLLAESISSIIIDHNCCDLTKIPENFVTQAKQTFRIAYGHTSHGSQIVTGMSLIQSTLYSYGTGTGQLYFRDNGIPGASDLGNPDRITWAVATRNLLKNNTNNINLIMWSWCGQANTTQENIQIYLDSMNSLEEDFPNVKFVYMTGHLYPPGSGGCETGNNNLRNEQIRQFCKDNGKILFDFADIESYDPDGEYFLDDCADDGCNYYNAQGQKIGNWANEWCNAHPGDCENCSCAHSHCLNCQQKGKAFWWMMACIAGWDGIPGSTVAVPTIKGPNSGSVDDDGIVDLQWNAVNNAIGYNIEIAEDTSFSPKTYEAWVVFTDYTTEQLELGKRFYWRVRANTINATGAWSAVNNVIIRLPVPVLEFPLDNEKIEGTDVSLQWLTVVNADEYEVQVSDNTNFSNIISTNKGTSLRFVPSGLQEGKKYFWRVRASNEIVPSYWSLTRNFECLTQSQNEMTLNIDSLDFGDVEINSNRILPFGIINIGTVPIDITDIRILGTGASGFLLIESQFNYTIEPADSQEFHIKFLPVIAGLYEASVNIFNTSFTSPFSFNIKANAVPSTYVDNIIKNKHFELKCLPNPVNDELKLELNTFNTIPDFVKISIVNIKGEVFYEFINPEPKSGTYTFIQDVSSLASGSYFVIVNLEGKDYSAPVMLVK